MTTDETIVSVLIAQMGVVAGALEDGQELPPALLRELKESAFRLLVATGVLGQHLTLDVVRACVDAMPTRFKVVTTSGKMSEESQATIKKSITDGDLCSRCNVGRDTDRDGDCLFCAHLDADQLASILAQLEKADKATEYLKGQVPLTSTEAKLLERMQELDFKVTTLSGQIHEVGYSALLDRLIAVENKLEKMSKHQGPVRSFLMYGTREAEQWHKEQHEKDLEKEDD